MLKLRFSKPSIKTYSDGKITVCTYKCTLLDRENKRVVDEFSVTGTSKCAPTDSIDAAFGRKLADSRAKLMAYKTVCNFIPKEQLNYLEEEVNRGLNTLAFYDEMLYLKSKEQEHINFIKNELSA